MIPAGPGAPKLSNAIQHDKDLVAVREESPAMDELFDFAVKLEGMARHLSTHAAGVVIADRPIQDYVPLCTHDGEVVTQWQAPQLEELGLLKMDYLGLRTLTILYRALANIEKQGGVAPDLAELPEGDPATYKMLTEGDTLGVFQLESDGMRRLLSGLKPDCFEDLIAVLALYRPGPLESGMVEMFTRRKHGEEAIEYPHESLSEILEDTYGCIVYQEQVMLIASTLGGFSLNEADNLRKAMGKKKPEIMQKFSAKFIGGAVANGCEEAVAQETWDNIVKFGGYGFNKSHSTAYALITYQTAYLKANHRLAFVAANMSCEMQDSAKIKSLLDDCSRTGIPIHWPDVQRSAWEFEPEGDGIRFGLGAIKGTGQKAVEAILGARAQDTSKLGLIDLTSRADPGEVTKTTWEALIKAGCFDFTGHDRGAVLAALEVALAEGARAHSDRLSGQGALFGGGDEEAATQEVENDGIDDSKAWAQGELLKAEYEVLGYYLSGHPLEERAGLFGILSTTTTVKLNEHLGQTVVMAGLILSKAETIVKKGRMAGSKMARFLLEDLSGSVNVTCFPKTYAKSRELIEDDQIVVCVGKVEERQDEPGLLLDEVFSVDEAIARFEGDVVLRLEPQDRSKLGTLAELLERHQGNRRLRLSVLGEDQQLRRVRLHGARAGIALSAELARELDDSLGTGRLRLVRS